MGRRWVVAEKSTPFVHWWREPFLSQAAIANKAFRWWLEGENNEFGTGWKSPAEKLAAQVAFFIYEADARFRGKYLFGFPASELNGDALSVVTLPFSPSHHASGFEYNLPEIPRWRDLLNHDAGAPIYLEGDRVAVNRDFLSIPQIFVSIKTGERSKRAVSFNFSCSDRQIRESVDRRRHHMGLPPEVSTNRVMSAVKSLRKTFRGTVWTTKDLKLGTRRQALPWDWIEWLDEKRKPERERRRLPKKEIFASRIYELKKLRDDLLSGAGVEWIRVAESKGPSWRFTNT
jgi:hypothetical protein